MCPDDEVSAPALLWVKSAVTVELLFVVVGLALEFKIIHGLEIMVLFIP